MSNETLIMNFVKENIRCCELISQTARFLNCKCGKMRKLLSLHYRLAEKAQVVMECKLSRVHWTFIECIRSHCIIVGVSHRSSTFERTNKAANGT